MKVARSFCPLALVALFGCSDAAEDKGNQTYEPAAGGPLADAGRNASGDANTPGNPQTPPSQDGSLTTDASLAIDAGLTPGDGSTPPSVACGQVAFAAEPTGLRFAADCPGASLTLLPVAKIAGGWVGGGRTGDCQVEQKRLTCGAGQFGQLGVVVEDGKLRAYWDATKAGQLESVGLEGTLVLPSAKGFLSNGLQSWSQSGVLALGTAPTATDLNTALNARGEDEVYRKGKELSWWYTFVGGGELSFSAGAVSAELFRSYTQVHKEGSELRVRLISGAGEKVSAKAGERISGEWFQVELGDELADMLRRYGKALPSRRTEKPAPVPAGWNSWYDLWDDVRAEQITATGSTRNADIAKTMLQGVLPERSEPIWIVVDDGWQKAWGTWETNSKFPAGLDGLSDAIEARGMRAGLWFAPLLVDPDTELASEHPEWLVRGATYAHPTHGDLRVLDVTHPGAAEHLKNVVRSFVSAGMGLLKADFLFAGTWEGGRHEAMTGMQAYARALSLIREAAGQDTRLVAVGAPPLVTFEYVDAWRVGNDIAFKPLAIVGIPRPSFSFIANQARQVTSRWPYCLATLCDADPMLLRTLPREEVEVGAWVAAATGGALFLSDDLTKLPQERRSWGLDAARVELGLGGLPATPESFFPQTLPTELVNMKDGLFTAEHDIPSTWLLPNGKRLAFNFKDAPSSVAGTMIPGHAVRVLAPR